LLALACALLGYAWRPAYIKAFTYFGDAWPLNYWNSNLNHADADFKEAKADGFNAVILVVPWGEFQPGVNPVRFNDDAYGRLASVCQTAQANGLAVYLRVSYLWDMYPDEQMPGEERARSLLSNDSLAPAWGQYLKRLKDSTQPCGKGYFISWEDDWHVINYLSGAKNEQESAARAQALGFDAWVRRRSPPGFLSRYADAEKRLGAYPVPDRRSPDFRAVFEWFDDQLMNRLMPVLAQSLPNASLEVRVDDDPLYDGDKLVGWHSHHKTYKIASSPFVMAYWAPAMGAANAGEKEPAKKVIDRFLYMMKKIADKTDNKIFIEQFLFEDNTPSMAFNAAIEPGQIGRFLEDVADALVKHTAGYALWGRSDYDASTVFNGFFSVGTLGWRFEQGANIARVGDAYAARLPQGASIAQSIPLGRDHFRVFAKSMTLRFRASGPGKISVTYAGTKHQLQIGGGQQLVRIGFPIAAADTELSFTSESGTLDLMDISLFSFTQVSHVRDSLGNPQRHLADIRKLNKLTDAGILEKARIFLSTR